MSETPSGAEETVEIVPPAAAAGPSGDTTVELPAPARPALHPSISILFVAVAALGLLAGIGLAAVTRPAATGTVVARARVGPEGGTLTFDGRGVLRVPRGAVGAPVTIAVRRTVVPERLRLRPPEGPLYVLEPDSLVAYTFEPNDVTFLEAVTIVLPLPEPRRGGTVFSYVDGSALFFGGTIVPDDGTIAIEVSDFRFRAGRAPEAES